VAHGGTKLQINDKDLITKSYIRKQLWGNMASRELNNRFRLYLLNNPSIPEHEAVPTYLNNLEVTCVKFFTHKVEDVYQDHFLFYFTHAAYYEYTLLLSRVATQIELLESYTIADDFNMKTRLAAEQLRLQEVLENIYFEIREDPDKLWRSTSYLFLFDYSIESLPITNLSAYTFQGVYQTIPHKICYL
jgi:hypothetical protein